MSSFFSLALAQHLTMSPSSEQRSKSQFCGPDRPAAAENVMSKYRFDAAELDAKLRDAGLRMWVHGSVPQYKHFVGTYRKEDANDPMAFFKAQQFSFLPANQEMATKLATLKRHDEIRIKGRIFDNGSPLVHIRVSALEVVKPFATPTQNHYSLSTNHFANSSSVEVFAMIHALSFSEELGWALILETEGMIMPVAVPRTYDELAKTLYRGDIVNARLKIIHHPRGTTHFELDQPLEIVDALLHCHGQDRTLEGSLAKFDKSPAISLDVYAIRVKDENGLARNFTFFPEDGLSEEEFVRVFMAISAKAKAAWEASAQEPVDVRNFREKPTVRVKARGVINVVSTEQANAQIYIRSEDQVEFELRTVK